jgi:hypothetical protein
MPTDETKPAQPKKRGNPAWPCDHEIGARINTVLSTTSLGLKDVLEVIRHDFAKVPSIETVWMWLETDETFRQQYARARELQATIIHDAAQAEAENSRESKAGKIKRKNGVEVEATEVFSDNVLRSKLIVDTMLKRAAQLNPKKYSDKVSVVGDPDAPIVVNVKVMGMPEEQPKK